MSTEVFSVKQRVGAGKEENLQLKNSSAMLWVAGFLKIGSLGSV
jgi:hypothetical protein